MREGWLIGRAGVGWEEVEERGLRGGERRGGGEARTEV